MKLSLASLFADPDSRISRHQFRLLKVVFALWQTAIVGWIIVFLCQPMEDWTPRPLGPPLPAAVYLRIATTPGVWCCLSALATLAVCWGLAAARKRWPWALVYLLTSSVLWISALWQRSVERSRSMAIWEPSPGQDASVTALVLAAVTVTLFLVAAPAGDDRPWKANAPRWQLPTADLAFARGAFLATLGLLALVFAFLVNWSLAAAALRLRGAAPDPAWGPLPPGLWPTTVWWNLATAGNVLLLCTGIALTCFSRTRRWGWWSLTVAMVCFGLGPVVKTGLLWVLAVYSSPTSVDVLLIGWWHMNWLGLVAVMFVLSDANWFKPRRPTAGGRHLVLFDGECGLCTRLVRFLLEEDFYQVLTFAPLAGPTAQPMLERAEHAGAGRDTLVYVRNQGTPLEECYARSDAVLRTLRDTGGFFATGIVLLTLPCWLRDAVYRLIARSRGRLSRACNWQPLPSDPPGRFLP